MALGTTLVVRVHSMQPRSSHALITARPGNAAQLAVLFRWSGTVTASLGSSERGRQLADRKTSKTRGPQDNTGWSSPGNRSRASNSCRGAWLHLRL